MMTAITAMGRWVRIVPYHLMVAMIIAFGACGANMKGNDKYMDARRRMVQEQIAARDVRDPAVLDAMRTVPRHEFVPNRMRGDAYRDYPLPIGKGQTISQPYIVAYMTEALHVKKGDKVLEVGTGSGYQAAVLAQMGVHVYSIEIVESLAVKAREVLQKLRYKVHLRIGDGYEGWPQAAPFDGIIVTAAPSKIPSPLIAQLKEGGRLVIPVGDLLQDLKVLHKRGGKLVEQKNLPVRFVPMTGKAKKQIREN